MENFIDNDGVKIIDNGTYKDTQIRLIAINYTFKPKFLILIGSDKESGDGYIYDDLAEAKKDYKLILEGKFREE